LFAEIEFLLVLIYVQPACLVGFFFPLPLLGLYSIANFVRSLLKDGSTGGTDDLILLVTANMVAVPPFSLKKPRLAPARAAV
jgi:Na+/citrate or Na+/malate symporter